MSWWDFTHGGEDRTETFERPCGCKGEVERGMGSTERTVTEPCPEHKAEMFGNLAPE